MTITPDLLRRAGVKAATAAAWATPLAAACEANGITTPLRLAGFLACTAHETGDYETLSENLNYLPSALMANFGGPREIKYRGKKITVYRITLDQAQALGRLEGPGKKVLRAANQVAIANTIYGGLWGEVNLGNTQPGDGWLCRGGGGIQLTGRGNFLGFGKAIGWTGTLEELVAYVRTIEGAASSAAIYWRQAGCNALCDAGRPDDARIKCNGGTIGLENFQKRRAAMLPLLGLAPSPPPLARPVPVAPTQVSVVKNPLSTDEVAATDALNAAQLARSR